MAFSFGATKVPSTATAFTLPTTAAPATTGGGLQFTITPLSTSTTSLPSLPQFSAGDAIPTLNLLPKATSTASATGFSSDIGTTHSLGVGPPALGLGTTSSVGIATTSAPLTLAGLGAATAPTFSLGTAPTLTSITGISTLPTTSSMTFTQLEDAINKWTGDLEDQGKSFGNLAKHLNAWDRLLVANGEKVLNVSNGIDRIKQQQQQLDQELDFILAQQKELEDCIVPLENELKDVPVTDVDRDHTYKLAENIDAHLKQMSEDLKEIIDQLNESNKAQELTDPVAQIGRILNAHMNSLQWIDRNTSQICSQLDEISKMQDLNKKNHENLMEHNFKM